MTCNSYYFPALAYPPTVEAVRPQSFRERVMSEMERWAHNISARRRNKQSREENFIPLQEIRVAHGLIFISIHLSLMLRRAGTSVGSRTEARFCH